MDKSQNSQEEEGESGSRSQSFIESIASSSGTETPSMVQKFISQITSEIFTNATKKKALAKTSSNIAAAEYVLETLLEHTARNAELRQNFEVKCRAHNQFGLFNMLDHVPDFEINDEMYEKLCFRECVIINHLHEVTMKNGEIAYEPESVGGICIDVQPAKGKQPKERLMEEYEEKLMRLLDEDGFTDHIGVDKIPQSNVAEDSLEAQNEYGYSKFLVHVSSQFDCNGENAGSNITTFVDRNCHTLEELRKEFITENEHSTVNEKSLYVALKHHWYYVKHTSSLNNVSPSMLYSIPKAKDYISEGANFILMRYLAIQKYCGGFELSCMYIDGSMCRNIYHCYGPEEDEIQGKYTECCRIKRTIVEESGAIHECIAVLSLQGKLLKVEWNGCNYVVLINPLSEYDEVRETYKTDANELNWMDDLQLVSKYLDRKQQLMLESKSYDLDHPELRQIMADYVNHILLLRPPDIMAFTCDYFGVAISKGLPRNDFFDES